MSDNKPKNNSKELLSRSSVARQGAGKQTLLSEHRERIIILPEERKVNVKYQIKSQQYSVQSRKTDTGSATNLSDKSVAAQGKDSETASSKMNASKTKNNISNIENTQTPQTNILSDDHTKDAYEKAAKLQSFANANPTSVQKKAAALTEKIQTNIDLSKNSTFSQSATNETMIYKSGKNAQVRANLYREKSEFYLNKMKKNAETGKREVNSERDKGVGGLYKKAYRIAHKEELLGEKDTIFDTAQSAIQFKAEFDNAINKDSIGETAAAAATMPFTLAADKVVRDLSKTNGAIYNGKAAVELMSKINEGAASGDSIGESAANSVAAVPNFVVQKKVEKTVQQVVQAQHDRLIEAQKERLRQKQEKIEKRAQQMKKEHMQRKMKVDLYKSEHGITSVGNGLLRNAKAAIKSAIDGMKSASLVLKSPTLILLGGGALIFLIIIILILSAAAGTGSWEESDELIYTLTGTSGTFRATKDKDIIKGYVLQIQNCMDVYQAKIWFNVCDWVGASGTYQWGSSSQSGPRDEKTSQKSEGPDQFTMCWVSSHRGNGKTDCMEFNDEALPGLNNYGNTVIQSSMSAEELLSIIALAKILKNNMDQPDGYSYSITAKDISDFIKDTDFVPVSSYISTAVSCRDHNCRRRLQCTWNGGYYWVYFCHGHHQQLLGNVGQCKTKDELINIVMNLYDANSADLSREECVEICDDYLEYIKETMDITERDYHYFGGKDKSRSTNMYRTLHQGRNLVNDYWNLEKRSIENEDNKKSD